MGFSFPFWNSSLERRNNWVSFSCHAGASYYNSKDPYDNTQNTVYGHTFDMGLEQSITSSRQDSILRWHLNIDFIYANQEEYGLLDTYKEKSGMFNTDFQASYKLRAGNTTYLGPLLGYYRSNGNYEASYQHGIDTDSDGFPDTVYTSPKNSFSFTDNVLRAGFDMRFGNLNLKPYYNYNISYNSTYSGPGIDISWGDYGIMPYLKISSNKDFSRMTNFDIGVNILFFDIGIKSLVSGEEKMPRTTYGYFGARVIFD